MRLDQPLGFLHCLVGMSCVSCFVIFFEHTQADVEAQTFELGDLMFGQSDGCCFHLLFTGPRKVQFTEALVLFMKRLQPAY